MPHPCEDYIRDLIHPNDFNIDNFVKNELTAFWICALDYLETEGMGKEEGLFRKKRYINIDEFIAAISCVISKSKFKSYSKTLLNKVSSIFQILLHPKTPDRIRRTSNLLLYNVIKDINESDVYIFKEPLKLVIPWSVFAREGGNDKFLTIKSKKCIVVSSEKQGKPESDQTVFIVQLIDFLLKNWKDIPNTCSKIVIENLLLIVYMPFATKSHIPALDFGFGNPTPPILNECIMKNFFDKIPDSGINIRNLSGSPLFLTFLLEIIMNPINMGDMEMMRISLKFARFLMNNRDETTKGAEELDHIFLGFLKLVSQVLMHANKEETYINCNEFVESLIKVVMKDKAGNSGYNTLVDLIEKYKNKEISIVIFLNAITYCLQVKEDKKVAYNFISRAAKKGRKFIGALMKYSRYMAVLCLPSVLNVDYEVAKDLSTKHSMRKERTKQETKRDWFAANYEIIFKKPEVAKPRIETTLFLEEEKEVEKYYVPPVKITKDNNVIDTVKLYLSIIENYVTEDDRIYRQYMFAPFMAFHSTMSVIRYPPIGIETPKELFFFGGEKLLLQEAKTYDDAFFLLQKEMSTIDSRKMSSKEMQVAWQEAVRTKIYNSSGLSAAVSAITTGEYNSLSLVEDILKALENQSDVKETHMDILRLYPLFTEAQQKRAIKIFEKWSRCCNPDIIGPACLYFMTVDKNLQRPMMDKLLVCCRRNSVQSLCTLLSAIDYVDDNDIDTIIDIANLQGRGEALQEASSLFIVAAAAIVTKKKTQYATKLISIIQVCLSSISNPPQDFIDHIQSLISYLLVYSQPIQDPYRFSNLSTNNITEDSRIFTTDETTFIHLKQKDDIIGIETEELSGHFHYNYKPINTCDVKDTRDEFSFGEVIKSKYESKEQSMFTKDLFSTFNIKDIRKNEEVLDGKKFDFNIATPMPDNKIEHEKAALLQSLGFYKPNDCKINCISTKRPLSLHFGRMQNVDIRVQIKCAIIYVSDKISTQNEILNAQIEDTSPQFKEFISGIGQTVDLGTHTKYDGLLKCAPGVRSVYYSNELFEIMFHVCPLLQMREDDPQQVYKKRHIGNDYITIVWCEAGSFDTQVITSQFNFVHIIIYTLPSGYYCVETHKKEANRQFGPLPHIAVCDKKSLYSLVRKTVIEAQLSINSDQINYKFPSIHRNRMIDSTMKDKSDSNMDVREQVFF